MSPTVEVQIRRNRNGSLLAYSDRDHATSVLADHRAVLHTLYDLVDRRHGADGDVVARIVVAEDAEAVDDLDLSDRFRRDLNADRAISLVEDLRYHAGERKLVADGGEVLESEVDSGYFWTGRNCPDDDCDGDLQQQDWANVMCLSCERIWMHSRDSETHKLRTQTSDVEAEEPILAKDGGEEVGHGDE